MFYIEVEISPENFVKFDRFESFNEGGWRSVARFDFQNEDQEYHTYKSEQDAKFDLERLEKQGYKARIFSK